MLHENPRLGVIGFGEVGYHISKGLKGAGITQIVAYNNGRRNRPPYTKTFRKRAESIGVRLATTANELAMNSDLILSTVVPTASVESLREVVQFLTPAHLYVDLNSCSAAAKQDALAIIKKQGASYVDGVILGAPVRLGHRGCIFASGEDAGKFRDIMSPYGMDIRVISGKVGDAALLKQVHSVIGKGIQALLWESLLAMHKAGLDPHVFDGLDIPISRMKLFDQADSMIGRSALHAERRSGEMDFAADTLRRLGVEPIMTEATAKRLAWCASFKLPEYFGEGSPPSYKEVFRILDTITQKAKESKS